MFTIRCVALYRGRVRAWRQMRTNVIAVAAAHAAFPYPIFNWCPCRSRQSERAEPRRPFLSPPFPAPALHQSSQRGLTATKAQTKSRPPTPPSPSSGLVLWPHRALSESAGEKAAAGRQASHRSSGTLAIRPVDESPRAFGERPDDAFSSGSSGTAGTGRPASGADIGRRRGLTKERRRPSRHSTTQPPAMKKAGTQCPALARPKRNYFNCPWQCLYFLPLPHGQGSLRPTRGTAPAGVAAFRPGSAGG